jgi:hypothetical protein
MSSFSLSGGVEVFGFISPSDTSDTYPVIDPLYGIDGLRNVDTITELNNIPILRRRTGMVVGVSGGTTYYKLNLPPWNNTITDWSIFNSGGSSGGTLSGDYLPLSGGTVSGGTEFTNGLTANTISASTYLNLPQDIFVTGGTYSAGTTTFTNNSGGTFNVVGFYTGETSYVNSLNVGVGLSGNSTSGNITIINTDPDQVVTISGGTGITTGGTYPNFTITNSLPDQTIVLNNGANIDVSGVYPTFTINVTGLTDNDIYVTGFTYSANTFTIYQNSGSSLTSTINNVTGLTINGDLNVTGNTELSGLTTVYGDTPTSAAIAPGINNSYDLGSPSFRWREIYTTNIDATNVVTAYSLYSTYNTGVSNDLTVSGNTSLQNLTATTISATTYQNLPTDIRVTGGTYSSGTTTFTNNTGGTFNVSGYYTGGTDVFVTGGTYTAGTATFTNNTGGTFNVTGFTTGGTSSSYWQYRKTYNSFHATAGLSGSGNQAAILSNILFAFPIDVKRDVTISSLVIGNVGASAGNSVWGVYDSLNGEPNNLIFQTTAFNNAVTGAVSYTISPTQSLTIGIYWVVYHSSSTPTLRVMQVANSVPNIIGENGSLFNGSMTYLFRSLVYSGTLPSPFGTASLPSTISLIPFVQFGVTY